MNTIPIILRGSGTAIEYRLRLALDSRISDFRLNAQTLVGFDDQMCHLILDRTDLAIVDSMRVEETEIQPGDILTVVPLIEAKQTYKTQKTDYSQSSIGQQFVSPANTTVDSGLLVSYRLVPLINGSRQLQTPYVVQLQPFHENNPVQFFQDYDFQERKNLRAFLEKLLNQNVSETTVDRAVQTWCDDIGVGHKETILKLD